MTHRVRPYSTADAEAVLGIWWESWHSIAPGLTHPQPFDSWRSRWFAEIAGAQTIVVAANESESLAGFAAAHLPSSELTQLFVAPAFKRAGIGHQLLIWAQHAMPAGFKLRTLTLNLASQQFYDKHGLIRGVAQINPHNGMPVIEYRWTPPA